MLINKPASFCVVKYLSFSLLTRFLPTCGNPSLVCFSLTQPDAGPTARHPLHQDLIYFPVVGPTIGVWTAVNPATRENGCLSFLPGTHRMGLLRHDVPPWDEKNAGFHGVVGITPDNVKLIYAEIEPGDTIFFHPFMIHGSGRNQTKNFRKSLTGHFMSTDVGSIALFTSV